MAKVKEDGTDTKILHDKEFKLGKEDLNILILKKVQRLKIIKKIIH